MSRRSLFLLCCFIVVACGGDGGEASTSTGGGGAGGTATGAGGEGGMGGGGAGGDGGAGGEANTINGCSPSDLEACLYAPETSYEPGAAQSESVSYTDEAGLTRTIEIELRRPMNAPTPLPIVVWSHGGSAGKTNASNVGQEAGEAFVEAGYLVVAVAHTPRDKTQYDALCTTLGLTGCGESCTMDSECTTQPDGACIDGGCRYEKNLSWDRPNDVAQVISTLEARSASGQPLDGLIDPTRVLFAGHSAGGGAALMMAGATRELGGTQLLVDPRPVAFISASPQGPGDDGFTESSFDGSGCASLASDPNVCFSRPHLFLTGVGDDTSGIVAENRRLSFDLAPSGDRLLLWNLDEAARHNTFKFETSACASYANAQGLDPSLYPQRCQDYVTGQRSVSVAFADAYLRSRPEAQAYLASDNLAVFYAEQGAVERK